VKTLWVPGLLVVGALCAPALLPAQACFRGRPQPACRSFWLTEAEAGTALVGRNRPSGNLRLGIEVGWMHALGQRSAIGGGIAAVYDQSAYASLRPRYRRWLSGTWALDLSPGIRWTPGRIETVEARLALSWRDLGGVWTEVDGDLLGSGGIRWLAGIRSGGQVGIGSYVVGVIVGAIYVLSFPRD
jgi:hypothetical protein